MSDQKKAAYLYKQPATNVGNNSDEIRSRLDADIRQGDKHARTGRRLESQAALSPDTGLRVSERLKREVAVDFARASVRLEGFVPSRKAEMDAQRFIDGEITLSEFVNAK